MSISVSVWWSVVCRLCVFSFVSFLMFLAVFALNFKPVDECSIWGEVIFHLFAVPLRREVRAQQRSRSYKEALRFSPAH